MKIDITYSKKEIRAAGIALSRFIEDARSQGILSPEEAAKVSPELQLIYADAFRNHKWVVKNGDGIKVCAENRETGGRETFILSFETDEDETAGLFHIFSGHSKELVMVFAKLKKAMEAIMELLGACKVFSSIQQEAEKLRSVLHIIRN